MSNITNLDLDLRVYYAVDPRLQELDITSQLDRATLIVWYLVNVKKIITVSNEDQNFLISRCENDLSENFILSNFEYLLWQARDDLRSKYDINKEQGLFAYKDWLTNNLLKEMPILIDMPFINGVNIIGFPMADMGIGEDSRTVYSSLSRLKVNAAIIDAPLHIDSTKTNSSLRNMLSGLPLFKTNIFCFPALETLRLYKERRNFFKGRYNIAYWPWELSKWPDAWQAAIEIVDEIWCPSSFICETMSQVTQKPLHIMTLPVQITKPDQPIYKKAGDETFRFLFIFDGLSFPERKNPICVIRAFQLAFPHDKNENVELIIKSINLSKYRNKYFTDLHNIIVNDHRIRLIDELYSQQGIYSLYEYCDAYISLHRAEGFGRTIAEAMLFKKPVIVSNYSGNTDFCNSATAYLVNGKIKNINKGEYHFADAGQQWFDPDVNEAAIQLKLCFDDMNLRMNKINSAFEFIKLNNSYESCGQRYLQRLKEINAI